MDPNAQVALAILGGLALTFIGLGVMIYLLAKAGELEGRK